MLYDRSAAKKPVNLSVNGDLVRLARERGINLSHELETRLTELLKAETREAYLERNREAFAAYERFVEEYGVFGDEFRQF